MIKKQIFRNFISAGFSKIAKLVTSLFLVPVFIDELGKEGYGIIILIGSITSLSVLFEFGIRAGLVRFLSHSNSLGRYDDFNKYINTSLVVYFTLWIALSNLLIICAPFIVDLFSVSDGQKSLAVLLLRTFSVLVLLVSFISPIFSAVSSALNRYDVTNYRQSFMSTFSIAVIIIAVKYFDVGIMGWAVLTIFFDVITTSLIVTIAYKLTPYLKLSINLFDFSKLREMIKFGIITFIGNWSRKMKIDADPLIISNYFSPIAIPIYRAGVSMPSHTRPLIAALSGQIHTVSTAFYATGDKARFEKVFETGTKFTLLMGIPAMVLFLFFSENILLLWLGDRFTPEELQSASLCMKGMALIDFCFYLEGSSYAILYGMNKLKFMTFTDIGLGVINIVSSVLLIKYSGWGIPSVLLPTIVIEGTVRPMYLFYTAGIMGYAKRNIMPKIYSPVFIVLLVTIGVAFGSSKIIPDDSILSLIGVGVLVGLVWVGSTWFFGLSKNDKSDVLQTLKLKK